MGQGNKLNGDCCGECKASDNPLLYPEKDRGVFENLVTTTRRVVVTRFNQTRYTRTYVEGERIYPDGSEPVADEILSDTTTTTSVLTSSPYAGKSNSYEVYALSENHNRVWDPPEAEEDPETYNTYTFSYTYGAVKTETTVDVEYRMTLTFNTTNFDFSSNPDLEDGNPLLYRFWLIFKRHPLPGGDVGHKIKAVELDTSRPLTVSDYDSRYGLLEDVLESDKDTGITWNYNLERFLVGTSPNRVRFFFFGDDLCKIVDPQIAMWRFYSPPRLDSFGGYVNKTGNNQAVSYLDFHNYRTKYDYEVVGAERTWTVRKALPSVDIKYEWEHYLDNGMQQNQQASGDPLKAIDFTFELVDSSNIVQFSMEFTNGLSSYNAQPPEFNSYPLSGVLCDLKVLGFGIDKEFKVLMSEQTYHIQNPVLLWSVAFEGETITLNHSLAAWDPADTKNWMETNTLTMVRSEPLPEAKLKARIRSEASFYYLERFMYQSTAPVVDDDYHYGIAEHPCPPPTRSCVVIDTGETLRLEADITIGDIYEISRLPLIGSGCTASNSVELGESNESSYSAILTADFAGQIDSCIYRHWAGYSANYAAISEDFGLNDSEVAIAANTDIPLMDISLSASIARNPNTQNLILSVIANIDYSTFSDGQPFYTKDGIVRDGEGKITQAELRAFFETHGGGGSGAHVPITRPASRIEPSAFNEWSLNYWYRNPNFTAALVTPPDVCNGGNLHWAIAQGPYWGPQPQGSNYLDGGLIGPLPGNGQFAMPESEVDFQQVIGGMSPGSVTIQWNRDLGVSRLDRLSDLTALVFTAGDADADRPETLPNISWLDSIQSLFKGSDSDQAVGTVVCPPLNEWGIPTGGGGQACSGWAEVKYDLTLSYGSVSLENLVIDLRAQVGQT